MARRFGVGLGGLGSGKGWSGRNGGRGTKEEDDGDKGQGEADANADARGVLERKREGRAATEEGSSRFFTFVIFVIVAVVALPRRLAALFPRWRLGPPTSHALSDCDIVVRDVVVCDVIVCDVDIEDKDRRRNVQQC